MKILDTAMTEIVGGNSARYYSKYVVDGKEHTDTLNNFKFQSMINPNNEITIGNTCASGVTFSIYMPTVSLENKEITIYEGVKVGAEIKYIQLGIFTVIKQTSDGEYTSYEAYDRMYKADMPYFSDLTFPSTDKAILNEICGKLGISLTTNITTEHTISDKPEGYTYREIIGYMAILQGSNAVINADGNLELRWYTDSGYVLDGHKYYQQGVTFTTSKDFNIQKLTCNNTKSGSTEQSEITAGDGTTGLTFANPFMTQEILDEVYKKIGGFTFRPIEVKFVGDYRLEVGDIITVNKAGVDYKVPIMQITHECDGGLMDTVTSIGQSDTENTSVASGPITKQMERYYADLIIVNKALINKLSVDEADIRYASIENLKAVNANIDSLKTNKLDATYADIINANVESLKAANAEITNLKANMLTADIADIKYAQIDFANVKGQVIGTSLIKDGAVTNEKVQSLSANKLTAGTIDASKITVTNLNADNITVGTINGKRIGTGSIDLDKLAEEVPTKEYLDKVQNELQGQIDGNIETFTKTEIPTLNNEPAVNWTDNATRKKHIGDICYVVNPASSADGYSYRFANTGTEEAPTYEWVLIKDSDVTKALQDIININGEITGIKKFDETVSSWQTNTNNELSSLKTRTTTLETDMGNKVDTKTFNEVKQTVDENSSTITKVSETVTTVSSTAESAKAAADSATSTANTANKTANEAKTAASNAETAASNSATSASNAANSATKAENAATSSATSASNAEKSATNSANSASSAASSASTSATEAANAKKSADIANTNASAAVSTANTAKSTADSAKSTADTAKSTADAAKKTADENASTVKTLTTTVNEVKQTADSNKSSISSLTSTVAKKANQDEVTSISNKLTTVEQNLNGLTVDVTNQYQYIDNQLNGNHKIYEITYAPTKDNYPANEWSLPIYPSDDIYPSDNTWQYTEDEYENYVGTIAYWKDQQRAWRFIRKSDGSHVWVEISATETTYLLNQNATLRIDVNNISTTLSSLTTNVQNNYSTTVQMNNAITQAVSAESNSIKSEISNTYVTKNTLTGYSTTEAMNNAITQAVTAESNSIKSEISKTYATTDYADKVGTNAVTEANKATSKTLESYSTTATIASEINPGSTSISSAVTAKLGNYATTASLDLYIKKDPTSGELKSAIEAIADDITLKASGTINISGNKSVNINGNLFTLTSTNTTIAADGSIDCKKLKAVNADLEGTFKNVNTTTDGYTMTTTIIGGEYRIKSSNGSYFYMQGHIMEMSKDKGEEVAWTLSRNGVSLNVQTVLNSGAFLNGETSLNATTFLNGATYVNDYSNIKIYHPSIRRYMQPALSMSNPVTFDWSGSALTIYVDNVAVATWDWGAGTWS